MHTLCTEVGVQWQASPPVTSPVACAAYAADPHSSENSTNNIHHTTTNNNNSTNNNDDNDNTNNNNNNNNNCHTTKVRSMLRAHLLLSSTLK